MTRTDGFRPYDHGSVVYLTLAVLVAALGGLLFGYDTAVIAGAIGFLEVHFQLDPAMVGWATSSALAGCLIGSPLAGPVSDRFGRRNALILAAVFFFISAVGTGLPRTFTAFVFYRWLGGLGVGMASLISPMYIAEISPARIRGRMVSVNQFAIVTGMLVVYFVNYFIVRYGQSIDAGRNVGEGMQQWNVLYGWRWMFGSEALPAFLLLVLLFFVPESPRWLLQSGRHARAMAVLTRVNGQQQARLELAEIQAALSEEPATIGQLFTKGLLRVLILGVSLAVLQQVTGINVFLYYAPEILKNIAGSGVDVAMLQTVVVGTVNLLFTIIAIWTVDLLGRKPLMIVGAAGMFLSLAGLGTAAMLNRTDVWVLAFILGYIACFALAVGPVTWVILSEIFPNRVRGRSLGIATFCLWTANFIVSQTFPMLDKNDYLVETIQSRLSILHLRGILHRAGTGRAVRRTGDQGAIARRNRAPLAPRPRCIVGCDRCTVELGHRHF